MEPELPDLIDPRSAIQGLVILTLIPIVIYALWADYFMRELDRSIINNTKNTDFNPDQEVEKVRTASLFVILFQFILVLSSPEVRQAFPLMVEFIFVCGIALQLFIQFRLEKQIQPKTHDHENLLLLTLRVGTIWGVGVILYLSLLLLSLKIASWIGTNTFILFVGGALGVMSGLVLNFALGPILIKKMFPTHPLTDSQIQDRLNQYFIQAGLQVPRIWVIEITRLRITPVSMAGFQHQRSPFQSALFISRWGLDSLSKNELDALVLNQISHASLKHNYKRLLFSFGLIVASTFLTFISVLMSQNFLPISISTGLVGPATALLSFILSFYFLSTQTKKHELEADLHTLQTLQKFDIQRDDFTSALRKIDLPTPSQPPLYGHPETERRIKRIEEHVLASSIASVSSISSASLEEPQKNRKAS